MLTRLLPQTELHKTLLKTIIQAVNHVLWFRLYKRNGELLPVQCLEERDRRRIGGECFGEEELYWLIDIGEHEMGCFPQERTTDQKVEKSTRFESVNVDCGGEESALLSLADNMAEGLWDFYFGGYSRWHYISAPEYHQEGL